jgi:integrase
MRSASYVFHRRDTGSYFFRWTIPANARPLLGGRTEIKKSLHTDRRSHAVRLARRLSVLLEGAIGQMMYEHLQKKHPPAFHLTIALLERMVDGSIRMEGVETDPAHADEDKQLLAALLGSSTPTVTPSKDMRTLSDLVTAYFADGDRGNRWTAKTRYELQAITALMMEVLGSDRALNSLNRKDFAYYKEQLSRLPSNRRKNPVYREKTLAELGAMHIPPSDLLNPVTINKNLRCISAVMKWGQIHGFVEANYCEGLSIAAAKRSDEHRQPYTDAEALHLQTSALGSHSKQAWKKWIPLLLMYQGMRTNEAAQLMCADFNEVEGIPVLTITDEGGRRVKTAASRRTIPIHPELVRLGLLEHIAELRTRDITRCWPELSQGRDGPGKYVSRWYASYRQKLGLGKDAHSLRHTVVTKLREAGIAEDLIADIVGHSRSDKVTFGTYAKAASIRRMADALNRLSYTEKQSHLRLVAA